MPISRKKACSSCRGSKARCSMDFPCCRCSERGILCTYETMPNSISGPPEPATSEDGFRVLDSIARTSTVTDSRTLGLFDDTSTHSPLYVMDPWLSLNATAASPYQIEPMGVSDTTLAPTNSLLRPRKMANPEAFLTSKVLHGQLTSYPAMMIDGRGSLPPFIFPQCILEGKTIDECRSQAKGNHACLPETLAVCTSLLHMFFTRTPASSTFVWETIYAYLRQLRPKARLLASQELVTALQAVVLFLLLQASDMRSVQFNDALSLISTAREMAEQIHMLDIYQGYTPSTIPSSLGRRDWVIQESARRCLCVLYMIELVFDVIFSRGIDRVPDCRGYAGMPLPADRTLWEATDNPTWARRYCESVRCRPALHAPATHLTIADLRQVRRRDSSVLTLESETARSEDLEFWCETADEFGSLIWMSVMMERTSASCAS
ncbi:hypothetical protein QBC34DRAFT_438122 [Podospora aff. communis PSN243]|uniref:Zn(2)-C6 fungal-type domain-containing protein n=1 Tax=Podospora aff. communis PSN243 TaxID=3040156 RepID=A0AAV9GLJ6_9PEZI|nr:hypothetical protein QBC34DRAFT_438122 [Podospora aff. communis PSN243]